MDDPAMTATLETGTLRPFAMNPDEPFRGEWSRFEQDPGPLVVLLGCQRSGTTLLHLQLARSGAFRFVSASDVYSANRLVYNERHGLREAERANFSQLLQGQAPDRGIDAIPAGPDTPEEYGLVMANATDGGIRYDQPDTTEATLPALRELCAKKALLEGQDRPLLLKSPPDYADGIAHLAGAFPRARFIVIHRHPLSTLQSQVRAWRRSIQRKNAYLCLIDRGYRKLLEDPGHRMRLGMFLHSEEGVGWLADCILHAHLTFLTSLDLLNDRVAAIRYEDLCTSQSNEFNRLSNFLGMKLQEPPEQPAPTGQRITDEVRRAFMERAERFAPFLKHCGYPLEIA
jgi:Sulfotransferase family